MFQELRYAGRRLLRTPGFTALAVLTLALGLGACIALFSLVESVLLRPLAYRSPQQLVWLRETTPSFGNSPLPINARHFLLWRERAPSFSGFAILDPVTANLTGGERPEQLALTNVSSNFFELLGTTPSLGRSFLTEEETAGRNRVVVLSDAFWRRAFSADPGLVGRPVLLDGEPHTVVGILPPNFQYPQIGGRRIGSSSTATPDVFRPKVFSTDELRELFGRHNYGAIARLQPGVTPAQAATELDTLGAQIVREAGMPPGTELHATVAPLHEAVVGHARRGLLVLFAAVGVLLLISCANLMGFLLARAERRQVESGICQALGASRLHLLRQGLVEALLIAGTGGTLGIVLASHGLALLRRFSPSDLPRLSEVSLNLGGLAFALGATLLTGLFFGLYPAWRLTQGEPQQVLGSGARTSSSGRSALRLRDLLVTVEVGLSVVLLATAVALAGSFGRLLRSEKGFNAPAVLSAEVSIPLSRYADPARRIAFFEQLVDRLAAEPGVGTAAMVNTLPLQGENWIDKTAVAGDPRPLAEKINTNVRFISPDYYRTLGIPLRAGRGFAPGDRGRRVAVISEQLARQLWPDQDPLGRSLERTAGETFEVVGVAGDVRPRADQAPVPTLYRPYWDWPAHRMIVLARTSGDPAAAAGAIRAALRASDPDLPLPALRTMDDILGDSIASQRFRLLLIATFAGAALLLSALGIAGTVAHGVVRRRKELGIRLALGGSPGDVQRFVIRQGLRPVLLGLAGGLGLSLATGHLLASLLYETRANAPLPLAAIAAFACWFPSRRAIRVDPLVALRAE